MVNGKNTIIATIGPSSLKENIIREMDRWGTDIFRINLSHTEIEDLKEGTPPSAIELEKQLREGGIEVVEGKNSPEDGEQIS